MYQGEKKIMLDIYTDAETNTGKNFSTYLLRP